jgi:hypothetical protein
MLRVCRRAVQRGQGVFHCISTVCNQLLWHSKRDAFFQHCWLIGAPCLLAVLASCYACKHCPCAMKSVLACTTSVAHCHGLNQHTYETFNPSRRIVQQYYAQQVRHAWLLKRNTVEPCVYLHDGGHGCDASNSCERIHWLPVIHRFCLNVLL